MPVNDELGKRMKENYENIPKTKLMRRTPVAIRIDGKAFHTFTRGFDKPFDTVLVETMQETTKYLCQNIQGCVFGYTQSDEITLILIDYQTLETSAWFDYEVQKMCSIAASMATMAFNKEFENKVEWFRIANKLNGIEDADTMEWNLYIKYLQAIEKGAMFDARCFNIPKEEVCNLIYWRQVDAIRNSIQMCGQAYFSHSELQGKRCSEIKDMLVNEKAFNWDELPAYLKRGSACVKSIDHGWIIDKLMPVLTGECRNYINPRILYEE